MQFSKHSPAHLYYFLHLDGCEELKSPQWTWNFWSVLELRSIECMCGVEVTGVGGWKAATGDGQTISSPYLLSHVVAGRGREDGRKVEWNSVVVMVLVVVGKWLLTRHSLRHY